MEMTPKPLATSLSFGWMKTVCLIFGVINAVICILAFLSSTGLLLFGLYMCIWNFCNNEGWAFFFYIITVIGFVGTAITGLALFFAILLCLGIKNDNKHYIKLYLIFGITVVAFSMVMSPICICLTYKNVDIVMIVLIAFGIVLVYSGFLELIHKTYFASGRSQEASGRLINPSNVPESYGSN